MVSKIHFVKDNKVGEKYIFFSEILNLFEAFPFLISLLRLTTLAYENKQRNELTVLFKILKRKKKKDFKLF